VTGNWTLAIDFGTTSTVAALGSDGHNPEIVEVDGQRNMPSVVVVAEDGRLVVGEAASVLSRTQPTRTVRTPKNRIGDQVPVVVAGQPHQPVTLVSAILEHVLREAVRHLDGMPTRTRLTYPATWNRPKRSRLLEAAAKAGLPDPELIAEPIAAALTYGDSATLSVGDHVVVYDLGGGTFDTVMLLRTETGFTVVGRPLGDPQLGGELFDEILMNHVGEQIDPGQWDELLISDDPKWTRAASRLRAECRRAKESLSAHPVTEVSVGLPSGTIELTVTRQVLDSLIGPYIEESIDLLGQCVADAGQTGKTIKAIYVTGGASRMPLVEERIREAYPSTEVSRRGDPKLAVALGALLAVPGSLDRSIAQAPDRTTVDRDVPPPPPATASPTATIADPTVPTTPAPTPPPAPQTAAPQPAVPQPAPSTHVAATTSTPGAVHAAAPSGSRRSMRNGLLIAIGVVLGTAGIVLAYLGATGDNTVDPSISSARDSVADSRESDSDDERTTTTATSTTTTTTTTTTPSTTATPTQAQISSASINSTDLPDGWSPVAFDDSTIDFCGIAPPTEPLADEERAFERGADFAQLVSLVGLYADPAAAEAVVEYDRTIDDQCPTTTINIPEVGDFDVRFIDLDVPVPALGDETATVSVIYTSADNPGNEIYQVGVDVRVGRIVTSAGVITSGEPTAADLQLMSDVLELSVNRLAGVPQ